MPIYEYKCEGCGEVFEVIQKFADEPLTVHEKCGGHVHRLLSAPALQFKGTGWYVTDYAKAGANGPSKGEQHTSDGEKGESGKSEAGKSDAAKSDASSKNESAGKSESPSKDTASKTEPKTESKPAASSDKYKND
ncbi:MAG: zinc ribbon domain-containing protein [Bryobacterales bacterium]|nr:zinc ribbon domain-containing protein [Bryobacterales bacterium]